MPIVSTPVLAYVASLMAGTQVQYSTATTVTICMTGAFEAQVPFKFQFSAASADPTIDFYKSEDGGVTFDTNPLFGISIPYLAQGASQSSIKIPTGIYAVKIFNSSSQTATAFVLTQEVLTAYVAS